MNKQNNELPIELKFNIIKYMHDPKTKQEIIDYFNISESTFSHNFIDTEVKFLNVEFPTYRRKISGKNKFISDSRTNEMIESNDSEYKSTVHPVVLPLNLTEVYALTNHLLDITFGSDDYGIYKEIAEKIYSQLSDYARAQIGKGEHHLSSSDTVTFTNEEEMLSKYMERPLIYALKAMKEVEITFVGGKQVTGKVNMGADGYIIETKSKKIKYEDIKEKIEYIELVNKSGK